MPILITDEDDGTDRLSQQAINFALHTLLAVGAWMLVMLAGYALNPPTVPQGIVLVLSIVVPMLAGNIVSRFRRDEMAIHVWLVGLIWLLIMSLWVLDMPTGPNACYQCGATEKLLRTFFSLPVPAASSTTMARSSAPGRPPRWRDTPSAPGSRSEKSALRRRSRAPKPGTWATLWFHYSHHASVCACRCCSA